MNALRQLIKTTLPAVIPERLFLTHGTRKDHLTDTSRQASRVAVRVSFTFDDGPHPEYTPRLLDMLKLHHQRATFFVIGEKAQQHPELIERIIGEGHEIGNHTFTHSEPADTSARKFLQEIKETGELLEQITGKIPDLVRPPKGKLTVQKMLGLWRRRLTVVLWDTDPRDYLMTDSREMIDWCRDYEPRDGNICLMHDNHPYAIEAVKQLSERTDIDIQSRIVSHWLEHKSYQSQISQHVLT